MQAVPLISGTVRAVGSFNSFQENWSSAEGISSQCILQSDI